MNVIIYAKNLELAEDYKKQIIKKFNKLTKFAKKIVSFRLDLSHDAHHRKGKVYRVEVNITVPEKMFRIVETDFDLLTGITKVRDILERQLVEYKEKLINYRRK